MSDKAKKDIVPLNEIKAEDVFKLLHCLTDLPIKVRPSVGQDGTITYLSDSVAQTHLIFSGSAVEEAVMYLAGHLDAKPSSDVDLWSATLPSEYGAVANVYELHDEETSALQVVNDGYRVHVLNKHTPAKFRKGVPVGMSNQIRQVVVRKTQDHDLGEKYSFNNLHIYVHRSHFINTTTSLANIDLNCSQVVLVVKLCWENNGVVIKSAELEYSKMFEDFMHTRQIIPTSFKMPAATVARALKKKRRGLGYFESARYVDLVKLAQQLYAAGTLRKLYLTDPEKFNIFKSENPELVPFANVISATFKVKNGLSWMLKCNFPSRPLSGVEDNWFKDDYPVELVTQLANKLAITQDGVRKAEAPIYRDYQVDKILEEPELAGELLFVKDENIVKDVNVGGIVFETRNYPGFACIPKTLNNNTWLMSTMFSMIVRPDTQKTLTPNARGYKDWVKVLQYEQSFWKYKGVRNADESHALNDLVLDYYQNIGIAHCLFESKTVNPYELMMISQRLTEVSYDRAERLIALFGMYLQRPNSAKRKDFAYAFFLKRDNGLLGKFTVEDARYARKHLYLHTEAIEFLIEEVHPANWRKVHDAVIKSSKQAGLLHTQYAMYMQMTNILDRATVAALKDIVDDKFIEEKVALPTFEHLDMKSKEGVLIFDRHRIPMPNDEEMAMLREACEVPDFVSIGEIVLETDLAAEGEFMSHCVGGYGASVKSSSSRIIRYRGDSRTTSATAEWRFSRSSEGVWNIRLNQIRGFSNRTPVGYLIKIDEALREYVATVINSSEENKLYYGFLSFISR